MRTIEEYFTHVYQLVQGLADVHAERYEEQILSVTRGRLRIRLRFSDQALLEMSEAVVLMAGEPRWLSYRYHYQDSSGAMVFRYDNAPHHPRFPHIQITCMLAIELSLALIPQSSRWYKRYGPFETVPGPSEGKEKGPDPGRSSMVS
jgi:Family of unknown function (DUF6516)